MYKSSHIFNVYHFTNIPGKIAPYFANYNPLLGSDGAYEYAAPGDFGSGYQNNFTSREGYWIKAYVNGNLTFKESGGSYENATYAWSDVRVDNGTGLMTLSEAAGSLLFPSTESGKLWYYNTDIGNFEYVDDTFGASRDYYNSWEGLFINVNETNLTLIRN